MTRTILLALALLLAAPAAHAQFVSAYPEIRNAVLREQGSFTVRARSPYRLVRQGYWAIMVPREGCGRNGWCYRRGTWYERRFGHLEWRRG
jgi:hypothetical protein